MVALVSSCFPFGLLSQGSIGNGVESGAPAVIMLDVAPEAWSTGGGNDRQHKRRFRVHTVCIYWPPHRGELMTGPKLSI